MNVSSYFGLVSGAPEELIPEEEEEEESVKTIHFQDNEELINHEKEITIEFKETLRNMDINESMISNLTDEMSLSNKRSLVQSFKLKKENENINSNEVFSLK
jgi:hypothetical protein